jgi:hypothetical protein
MSHHLSPSVEKYGSGSVPCETEGREEDSHSASKSKTYGHRVSAKLRDMLFPAAQKQHLGSYETLATLQALKMYYSHVEGHLLALVPASQVMWDREFITLCSIVVSSWDG